MLSRLLECILYNVAETEHKFCLGNRLFQMVRKLALKLACVAHRMIEIGEETIHVEDEGTKTSLFST